nr:MAG TPA: hypothetical protein [Caudoviricetes sp.]
MYLANRIDVNRYRENSNTCSAFWVGEYLLK